MTLTRQEQVGECGAALCVTELEFVAKALSLSSAMAEASLEAAKRPESGEAEAIGNVEQRESRRRPHCELPTSSLRRLSRPFDLLSANLTSGPSTTCNPEGLGAPHAPEHHMHPTCHDSVAEP